MKMAEQVDRPAEVGQHVIYVDELGIDHDALVTVVHGAYCVNLLYVSGDSSKQDQYGRQIERSSSVSRMREGQTTYGRYYRFTDEEKMPFIAPMSR